MTAQTLPDLLGPGLDIVSIGINPSLYSVARGYCFARPGNRFWPTVAAAGLIPEPLEPSCATVNRLFRVHRIGFTDLVKRPTARADALTAADYQRGARILRRKLLRFQPRIAWFHGTTAYRAFLDYTGTPRPAIQPGLQSAHIGITCVYVTPNPSGANPAANPKALLPLYRELVQLRNALVGTRINRPG